MRVSTLLSALTASLVLVGLSLVLLATSAWVRSHHLAAQMATHQALVDRFNHVAEGIETLHAQVAQVAAMRASLADPQPRLAPMARPATLPGHPRAAGQLAARAARGENQILDGEALDSP